MGPLLKPAQCSILFVDPRVQHMRHRDLTSRQHLTQRFSLIHEASTMCAVPSHVVFNGTVPDPAQSLAPGQPAQGRLHAIGTAGSSWASSGLAATLAGERRTTLVVCGFWLETTVTFLALPALATGYEVFILTDLASARTSEARRASYDRLLQAGTVPVTTHQLIAEWVEESTEPHLRSALSQLLASR